VQKLSLTGAVFIGLASMLGAGVFVIFGPAAYYAGSALPLSILLAALVAYLNAGSVAQLAAVVERSGGGYAYARVYVSKNFGFLAGSSFLVGKIGSSAAIALTVATYLAPNHALVTAIGAVILMTTINLAGINRTAAGSKILATITIIFLATLVFAAISLPVATTSMPSGTPIGVLSAAALFFFAFAGYARVATLGGEIRHSTRNVAKAIWISLATVLGIYLTLSLVLTNKLGADLPLTVTPLADLAARTWLGGEYIWIFAAIAGLGSLLALLAGMSRTAAEMASDGELPNAFAKKLPNGTPIFAELVVASMAIALVATGGIMLSLGISSFAVLLYYAITNFAAFRQPLAETKRSKLLNLLGLGLCLLLAMSVPIEGLIAGTSILTLVMLLRWGLRALR
jgi:APA family basic amino acid/polyamine antiporter